MLGERDSLSACTAWGCEVRTVEPRVCDLLVAGITREASYNLLIFSLIWYRLVNWILSSQRNMTLNTLIRKILSYSVFKLILRNKSKILKSSGVIESH